MIVFSVLQVQFAAQAEGTSSAPQAIVVSNVGNTAVTINSISIDGENSQQFMETHNCPTAPASLSPNRVCQIQVTFQPQVAGDLTATLSVTDNASGSLQSIALRGHAGAPVPQVALSADRAVIWQSARGRPQPSAGCGTHEHGQRHAEYQFGYPDRRDGEKRVSAAESAPGLPRGKRRAGAKYNVLDWGCVHSGLAGCKKRAADCR
jgi:hypothetical protein